MCAGLGDTDRPLEEWHLERKMGELVAQAASQFWGTFPVNIRFYSTYGDPGPRVIRPRPRPHAHMRNKTQEVFEQSTNGWTMQQLPHTLL